MTDPIRVMLVDDAPTIRRLLRQVLSSDPMLTVCSEASDGKHALELLAKKVPDIVILDVEMPVMTGLEALTIIRQRYPSLPVIMFSSLTNKGAESTVDALSLGADDYVLKPAGARNFEEAMESVRAELLPRIKTLTSRGKMPAGRRPAIPRPIRARRPATFALPRVLVIASSTGGPNALAAVVPKLPANIGIPVLVVQHMPPVFTHHLARRLDGQSPLTVVEAEHRQALHPGHVYIAPGDYHMEVARTAQGDIISLHQGSKVQSVRPAADLLFQSAASVYGAASIAVVLTGMGQDGLDGCRALSKEKACIIAQDEASSVVWGMPGHIAKAGLADAIVPLEQIPATISSHIPAARSARVARK